MYREHHKLVRDNIPEIIEAAGNKFAVEVLSPQEYQQALRRKLIEEAQEAAAANGQELVKELADLYEVIDALLAVSQLEEEGVLAMQQQLREERGGFQKRWQLLWTETD